MPSVSFKVLFSTGSPGCISSAKDWISKCEKKHKACRSRRTSQPFLPTRLIDIGESMDWSELRLYETSPNDNGIEYLVLSHCWGGEIPECLTSSTYKQMLGHINYKVRSRNFQDALRFTRQIGFKYLWIGSLCIVQGSSVDWEREAKKMSDVYAQAICTISSCGSPGSHGGCFHNRNPLLLFKCNLLFSGQNALTVTPNKDVYNDETFDAKVDHGPLSKRAWDFQERLFSWRIVHFGATFLFFECNTLFASEVDHTGVEYETAPSKREKMWDTTSGWFNTLMFYLYAIPSLYLTFNYSSSSRKNRMQTKSEYNPIVGYNATLNRLQWIAWTEPTESAKCQFHRH